MHCGASVAVGSTVVFLYITALLGFTEDVLVFSLQLNGANKAVTKCCVPLGENTGKIFSR